MSSRPDLRLDWCSHQAAKYAVMHWHYSKRMPKSKLVKIGVWEDGKFIGAVIYGCGAGASTNGRRFGLAERFEMAELVRVALAAHKSPTSKIVAVSVRMIHKIAPGLKLLTSFADSAQGHIGTIYQASGWCYLGAKEEDNGAYRLCGEVVHPRTLHDRFGRGGQSIPWLRANIDPKAERIKTPPKYHYVYPLSEETRLIIQSLTKPYPKRPPVEGAPLPEVSGGATPTRTLQPFEPLGGEDPIQLRPTAESAVFPTCRTS